MSDNFIKNTSVIDGKFFFFRFLLNLLKKNDSKKKRLGVDCKKLNDY